MYSRKGNVQVVLLISMVVALVIYAVVMSLFNIGSIIKYENEKADSIFMLMSIRDIVEAEVIEELDGMGISEEQYIGESNIVGASLADKVENRLGELTDFEDIEVNCEDNIENDGRVVITVESATIGEYKVEFSGITLDYDPVEEVGWVNTGSYFIDDWFISE